MISYTVDGIIRAVIIFDDFNIGLREDEIEIANILAKLTNSFNQTKVITGRRTISRPPPRQGNYRQVGRV